MSKLHAAQTRERPLREPRLEEVPGETRVRRQIIDHLLARGEAHAEAVSCANILLRARRLRIDQGHISLALAPQRRARS